MATNNNTATNVSAGKPKVGGAIYVGAKTATLPTTATAAIPTGFTCLGYISEDGLTNSNSPSTDFIKAWGGDKVLPIVEEREDTFSFSLIEVLNEDVLKLIYGDDHVSTSAGTTTVKVNSDELDEKEFIIDMVMRGDVPKRICIPAGVVSEIGDITYSDSDAVAYEVTIEAMVDADGYTHYEYIGTAAE